MDNRYEYISSESLYAEIKEMLKTYFDSGSIDDVMFPIWTKDALSKFRRSFLQMEFIVLEVNNNEAQLPDDFKAVREVWACHNIYKYYQSPNAYYYQKDCIIQDMEEFDKCSPCQPHEDKPVPKLSCPSTTCNPCDKQYIVTHKVTHHNVLKYNLHYLLQPGLGKAHNIYNISNCKIITNFCEGILHMVYYKDIYDNEDNILIPDNIRIRDYIRLYIITKIFETLSHQITDETLRQIENKFIFYRQERDEAYILADIESKKYDIWELSKSISRTRSRFRNFRLK